MKQNKYIKQVFWWGLLLITIVMVWVAQRVVPFMMDDEWYSTLLYSEEPIGSFADIIKAQIWHYQNWGGRTVTHTILQVILCLGETAADVLNTAAVFVLSYLIAGMAGAQRNLPFVVVTAGMLHGLNAASPFQELNPAWKLSMYWQSGACNYLYITIFILLFLLCYFREFEDDAALRRELWGINFWIIPLGLIVGWSNENMGPAVWLMTLGVILRRRHEKLPVRFWMIAGNVTCLVGSVLMILAPGNFVRVEESASNQLGLLWKLFLQAYYECRGLFDYLFPAVLFTLAVTFVFVGMAGEKLNQKEWFLLAGAVLSWGAMVLSPHYPNRAAFGTIVFLLCASLSQVKRLLELRPEKKIQIMLAAAGLFLWLKGMYCLGESIAVQWGWIV